MRIDDNACGILSAMIMLVLIIAITPTTLISSHHGSPCGVNIYIVQYAAQQVHIAKADRRYRNSLYLYVMMPRRKKGKCLLSVNA